MSDPGQLVELVSHIPPSSSDPATLLAGTSDATSNEANPFVVATSAVAPGGDRSVNDDVQSADANVAKRAVAVPAPSAIELECLLLSVATAEGISKIKALQEQRDGCRDKAGDEGHDPGQTVGEKHPVQGGVGEATVEMLGRLTNQLLSRFVQAFSLFLRRRRDTCFRCSGRCSGTSVFEVECFRSIVTCGPFRRE